MYEYDEQEERRDGTMLIEDRFFDQSWVQELPNEDFRMLLYLMHFATKKAKTKNHNRPNSKKHNNSWQRKKLRIRKSSPLNRKS